MTKQRAQGFSQGLALLGPSRAPGGVSCFSFTLRALGRGWEGEEEREGGTIWRARLFSKAFQRAPPCPWGPQGWTGQGLSLSMPRQVFTLFSHQKNSNF